VWKLTSALRGGRFTARFTRRKNRLTATFE
jgi:hypothetical protein